MSIKKNIQNEERSNCLLGILCTKLKKILSMLKKNWSPEDELLLKSEHNLKQKLVHSKNTSNIFLSSLVTFFTDNDRCRLPGFVKCFVLNPANLRTVLFGFHREGLCQQKIHDKKNTLTRPC